jgi:fission process protein 1
MNSAHRYVAYTSDIGESFRPVAHPGLIRTAYGISWLYLTGDVLHEGYKAYISNQATLRGGQVVSPLPEWLTPKSAEKSPSSEGTYKPEQVAKSVAEPITTPKPPYAAKPRKVSPLSDVRDDWDDGSKDAGKNLLNPKGTVPFLEDYRTVMVQRAIFQGLASMGLPALTIHTVCISRLVL